MSRRHLAIALWSMKQLSEPDYYTGKRFPCSNKAFDIEESGSEIIVSHSDFLPPFEGFQQTIDGEWAASIQAVADQFEEAIIALEVYLDMSESMANFSRALSDFCKAVDQ